MKLGFASRVFQTWVYQPVVFTGELLVAALVPSPRVTLEGASRKRLTIDGTSCERLSVANTGIQRLELVGEAFAD